MDYKRLSPVKGPDYTLRNVILIVYTQLKFMSTSIIFTSMIDMIMLVNLPNRISTLTYTVAPWGFLLRLRP